MSLPEAAANLLAHLGEEDEIRPAFALAHPLLRVVAADESVGRRRRATALIDEWSYGRILEQAWPALMRANPVTAFRFLCDRLADTVTIGFREPDGQDYTYVWRSAIEEHAQNLGNSLFDTLVEAVRDAAVETAATADGLALVTGALARYDAPVFRRIALHVLQHQGSPDLVADALTDRALAADVDAWHEYSELLRTRFADLGPTQQDAVLKLIAEGPQLPVPADSDQRDEAHDQPRRRRHWQLLRYAPIAEHLARPTRAAYEALVKEFGEPEHPAFLSYSSSWTGPTSPFSIEQLQRMDPAEVARALREWVPPGGSQDPSPEGLTRVLESAVAGQAAEFAVEAAEFAGLEATYIRGLLGGLAQATRDGTRFPWEPVFDLSDWVIAQPRGEANVADRWDRDPHWGWARKQIAGLLSHGFSEGAAEIPHKSRDRAWGFLKVLAEDPDPTPGHEERFGGDNMDPLTLSINTTRGEALHAVVRYALWIERALNKRHGFAGMESVPEVAQLLERHLDPEVDRSLAVRAVYGQWFAQFVRMDAEWACRIRDRVFPAEPGRGPAFDAAWDPYVRFTPAWLDVLGVLQETYRVAIDRMAMRTGRTAHVGEWRERLGDHLLRFRVLGAVGLDDDDLFATYWRRAVPEVQRQVLTQAGWSLQHGTATLEDDVRQRFVETWEWILTQANDLSTAPLAGFGSWLPAPVFDGRWLLNQARIVLELGVHLEPAFTVYGALQRLAPRYPRATVDVLRLMVTTDAEGWALLGSEAEARETVRAALLADDPDARDKARALVELLIARGVPGFRELLCEA